MIIITVATLAQTALSVSMSVGAGSRSADASIVFDLAAFCLQGAITGIDARSSDIFFWPIDGSSKGGWLFRQEALASPHPTGLTLCCLCQSGYVYWRWFGYVYRMSTGEHVSILVSDFHPVWQLLTATRAEIYFHNKFTTVAYYINFKSSSA